MIRAGARVGCLALLVVTTPVAGQRSGRRVLRAPDIAAAGWHRLGDVVSALMPGSIASVDGFNASITDSRIPFAGLSAAGSPGWVVRLDGQRVPVEIDGMWILDGLPVAMVQIDSVAVFSGSSIVDGQASLLGTIDIYTRRPKPGASIVGDYQHGDESGDPGPYRYTSRATGNVEKIGPFASGAAAYARGGWSLDGAARYSSLNITDTNITRRLADVFTLLQSDVNASGGSGVLTTSLLNGTQYTLGGRGRFTGLMWVPSQRRDEPVRVIATHGGSAGDLELAGTRLRYGLTAASLETRRMRVALPISIENSIGIADLFGEVQLPHSPIAIGAGVTRSWLMPTVSSTAPRDSFAERLWVTLGSSATRGATAAVARARGYFAPSATAWMTTTVRRFELTTSVASVQRGESIDQLPADTASGTILDVEPGAQPAAFPKARLNELRLELADRSRPKAIPSIDARIARLTNWRLNESLGSGPQTLDLLILGAGIESQPGHTAGSIRGEVAAPVGASPEMRTAMKSTPVAKLRGDVSRVVMTDFRLAASGQFTTSTSWPTQFVAGEMPDLPALRRIDVSANKPFWHERIRAQLVIRNLLAVDERYHPAGASWNFRTHLAITMALPPYSLGGTKP